MKIAFYGFLQAPQNHDAGVRKYRKAGMPGLTALRFWRLSLGNSYCVVKAMFTRDTPRRAGSEARGEVMEMGYFE